MLCELVVPTHVGMNRWRGPPPNTSPRSPHTRGDEPRASLIVGEFDEVVPTHVGMNLRHRGADSGASRSPHTRGDEP